VTNFAPHKALKLIASGKLTLDERVGLQRAKSVIAPNAGASLFLSLRVGARLGEEEFFINNLLVQIHLIIDMISEDRPCAMEV